MNTFYLILIIYCIVSLWVLMYSIYTAEPYPKEWEEEENEKLEIKDKKARKIKPGFFVY